MPRGQETHVLKAEAPHSSSKDREKHNTHLPRYVEKHILAKDHSGSEPFTDASSRTVRGKWRDGEPGAHAP